MGRKEIKMENDNKIFDAVVKDKELAGRMKQAFSKGATPQELAGVLKDAGIEVEASEVEEMVARLQAKRGESIAAQELNDDELDMVAGGGDGICDRMSTCDDTFIKYPGYPRENRCESWSICDEYWRDCVRPGPVYDGNDYS